MSHTPGPWTLSNGNVHSKDDKSIALIGSVITVEGRANARLIAAAPELLEAAQTIIGTLNARLDTATKAGMPVPVFDGIAALHDAVAKATGDEHGSDSA